MATVWAVIDISMGGLFFLQSDFVDKAAADAYIAALPPGHQCFSIEVTVT